MKPEALSALATSTMRPEALDAAATPVQEQGSEPSGTNSPVPKQVCTPFGERTDGTETAGKFVEEVVHGVKTAVDGALTWAEKKVDGMGLDQEQERTGPYTSPSTCMPSDLDAIASGILPAMPTVKQHEGDGEKKEIEKAAEKEGNDEERDSEAEPKK
ncbi:hypothetical protein BDW02DRAFT_497354 [Decorospora gaudefroyi]|uniref:Uncharacterized protein n=1 Tax=Decorospora gaudefroyi TaxID=184978 RepID=A0A6A5KGB1_9PLEO|nr:hypothetical protein BDW02DRAFT_497354 [Decorospora gaudefroyi]